MANYDFSPKKDALPLSIDSAEIVLFSGTQFGTGIANTASIYDLADYAQRVLYVDVTGANTGGVSAAETLQIYSRATNNGAWALIQSPTVTNTAYVFTVNPTGVALSAVWTPISNLKVVLTNVNTGTSTNTMVTATVKMTLLLKK
jgi:hypothetical protein